MAYKTTNVRYFDEAYQDSAPWEKYAKWLVFDLIKEVLCCSEAQKKILKKISSILIIPHLSPQKIKARFTGDLKLA